MDENCANRKWKAELLNETLLDVTHGRVGTCSDRNSRSSMPSGPQHMDASFSFIRTRSKLGRLTKFCHGFEQSDCPKSISIDSRMWSKWPSFYILGKGSISLLKSLPAQSFKPLVFALRMAYAMLISMQPTLGHLHPRVLSV